MDLNELLKIFNDFAPFQYAEDFDNVGLLVGNPQAKISGVLVSLDATLEVIEEAVQTNCNTIVAFHPIIFSGLKKITGKNYVEKAVLKAIQQEINIIAIHTALDNHYQGVSHLLAKKMGISETKVLLPKKNILFKLNTFVPKTHIQQVRKAIFDAGAGHIGNYSHCSFNVEGTGTFQAEENTSPFVGEQGKIHNEKEINFQCIVPQHLMDKALNALMDSHPYEEVAYEWLPTDNKHQKVGMGVIGELEKAIPPKEFIELLKEKLDIPFIRHSAFERPIKTVAMVGGSGSFAISAAMEQRADAFITADLKYHDFFEPTHQMLLCDVGHYESEQAVVDFLFEFIKEKITNFATLKAKVISNPVKYS